MKRTRRGVVVVMATLWLLAPAAAAFAETVWKVALFGPPRAVTKPLEWYAQEALKRTNGQLKIELVYGEALAKAKEMPEGLKAGAFEMAFLCASYYPGKFPLLTVLDLPMLTPDDIDAQSRLSLAMAEQPAVVDELKRWNTMLFLPIPLPQYQVMGKKRITQATDFKGVRVRVSGEMAKVLEDYGAVKSLVPAPETFTALERGVIDSVTMASTYMFASYRIYEVSKYFTDKISLGTQPCFYGLSLTAWDKLPPATKKTLLELREGLTQRYVEAYAAADEKNYAEFRKRGIEIINFPASERAKLLAGAARHWKAWVADADKRGLKGTEVFEFVRTRLK